MWISPDDLDSLEEILELLGDHDAIKELVEAEARSPPAHELIVARPAARAIAETLPEAVSAAVIDFITGSLIENSRRVGRDLCNELADIRSARRGSYRVLYRVDESDRTVTVLRIDHRGDVYRTT